jgi:hypothetical protein
MANRKTSLQHLVDRCRAVGWRVDQTSNGHYKVFNHAGQTFTLGGTGSKSSALVNERLANRYGLKTAERMMETKPAAEPQQPPLVLGGGDRVDGQAVINRQPAILATVLASGPLRDTEQVQLEDGSTVYQCTSCGDTRNSVLSARGHQANHTRRQKKAAAEQEAPEPAPAAPKPTAAKRNRSATPPGRQAPAAGTSETRMVVYDFPLRPDLMVRLTLPVDLTEKEAARLVGFARTLAF